MADRAPTTDGPHALIPGRPRILVDGPDLSGKTTLTEAVLVMLAEVRRRAVVRRVFPGHASADSQRAAHGTPSQALNPPSRVMVVPVMCRPPVPARYATIWAMSSTCP
jgi:hypothetical protein